MTLGIVGLTMGAIGPGTWSLDEALNLNEDFVGWTGLLIAAIGGLGGGVALLAGFWRPEKPSPDSA
jgi:putative oxidoreductase